MRTRDIFIVALGALAACDAPLPPEETGQPLAIARPDPGEVAAAPGAIVAPLAAGSAVSFRKPDGLILSTGNLYFTSHDAATAAVWRMAQTAVPGQEILLYSEPGVRFGDIVFAQVGGAFFGYFFVTDGGATIRIKRVPLTGGAATVIATLTNVDVANTHRNLVTDGAALYWQDDVTIKRVPIGGGAVTVLDTCSPNTPTAGIELQGGNIIYASVAAIRFVPTTGTTVPPALRTIATAASMVTALHAVSNGVYWAEREGPVRLKVGATTTTLAGAGPLATGLSSSGPAAGGTQAWSPCTSTACTLQIARPGSSTSMAIGADALGVSVTPAGAVFWGDAAGVHRLTF